MKFINFNMVGPNGQLTEIPVNPEQVCAILPIVIPGAIDGPDGKKIGKAAAALDFGGNVVPVDCSVKEARAKLEGTNLVAKLVIKKDALQKLKDIDTGEGKIIPFSEG